MLTDRAAPELRVLLRYPFRFVDPVTGRWVRARYRAERVQHSIPSLAQVVE